MWGNCAVAFEITTVFDFIVKKNDSVRARRTKTISSFFDAIDRDWLIKFLEHRIGDKRIIRLIRKWLNAGIIEETVWGDSGMGTPQGAVISCLLYTSPSPRDS